MKNTIVTNTILLSSLLFFSACANNSQKVKKPSLSAYNILGIDQTRVKKSPLFVIENQKNQNHYPFVVQKQNSTSQNGSIEVVSYGSSYPKQQRFYNFNTKKIKNAIEWNAKSFLGTKYVWGATGPKKFDCSGFTQWIYRDVGIHIPRVSRDQAKVGDYVRFSNLKRGDMVFFDTKKHRTGKVSHVGIYLGNGNFIHASSGAKKVVIYNFNDKPFYKKRFLWGRRVIHEDHHFASN